MPRVSLCPCHGMAADTSAPLHPGSEGDLGRFQAPGRNPPPSAPPPQLSQLLFFFFFLLFLCSAGPCYLPLTLTPSSSCLKFRLWTFPLGAVMSLFCVLDCPPAPISGTLGHPSSLSTNPIFSTAVLE